MFGIKVIGRSNLEIISRKEGEEDKESEENNASNLSEVSRENIELLGVSINIYEGDMQIMRYYNRGKHQKPWEDPNSELTADTTEEWEKVTAMEPNNKSNGMMISSEMICILCIPLSFKFSNCVEWIGNNVHNVEYMEVLENGTYPYYSLMLQFKTLSLASEFFDLYNGRRFTSTLREWAEYAYLLPLHLYTSVPATPLHTGGVLGDNIIFQKGVISADVILMQLPSCPLCLERMDVSVTAITAISTTLPTHAPRWIEQLSKCLVCKELGSGEKRESNENNEGNKQEKRNCYVCGEEENLWICIVCGYIGCGRYYSKHSYAHSNERNHQFALEFETGRIWFYHGDYYIHRLLHSAASTSNNVMGDTINLPDLWEDETEDTQTTDKLEETLQQYNYLLSSQLEEQRSHFEEKLEERKAKISLQFDIQKLVDQNMNLKAEVADWEEKLFDINNQTKEVGKKTLKIQNKLGKEREETEIIAKLNECVRENVSILENMNIDHQFQKKYEERQNHLLELQIELEKLYSQLA